VSPHDVAVALLDGPLDDARFRKVKRHLAQRPTAPRDFFEALDELANIETVKRIRDGMARVGVEPV
jgi:anti-sigma factor RsiW